jgi:hypothetical protein
MEKLDCHIQGIHELNKLEMIQIDGGNPIAVLIFIAGAIVGGIIYEATKYAAIESGKALQERASQDDYVIWADVGHR